MKIAIGTDTIRSGLIRQDDFQGVIAMTIGDHNERERLAEGRLAASETNVAGIVVGLIIIAAIVGFIFFMMYDRTPPGSSATSQPTTVTAQPKKMPPPMNDARAPAPTPSTR